MYIFVSFLFPFQGEGGLLSLRSVVLEWEGTCFAKQKVLIIENHVFGWINNDLLLNSLQDGSISFQALLKFEFF